MARILLIDDDPAIRDSLALILAAVGHTIEAAANGRAGLELARGSRFDLVLTDMMMPEMGGLEAVRALRDLAERPKIVVMTGGSVLGPDMTLLSEEFGADAHIAKPFRAKQLFALIDKVLARGPGA